MKKKDRIDFMALIWASMLRFFTEFVCILCLHLQREKRRRRAEKITAANAVANPKPLIKTGKKCSSILTLSYHKFPRVVELRLLQCALSVMS